MKLIAMLLIAVAVVVAVERRQMHPVPQPDHGPTLPPDPWVPI